MRPRWWICPLLAVPHATLSAQRAAPPDAALPYVVNRWTTDDGLPQNTVNDILQTPDGYLWLATYGGLVRFDGVVFTPFPSIAHHGIGSDRAVRLALDTAGQVWVGTEDGLVRYAGGEFRTFGIRDGLPHTIVHDVTVDPRGGVWVATPAGVARVAGETVQGFGAAQGVADVVRDVAVDDAGIVWARTDAGLLRLAANGMAFARDSTSALDIAQPTQFLGLGPDQALWVRLPRGIARWSRGRLERFAIVAGEAGDAIVDAVTARDGSVWLASRSGGVWHFRPGAGGGRLERYAVSNWVRSVFVDRDGTVWAGTNVDGLLRFLPRVFTFLPLVDSVAPSTTAILGDRSGRVWIGANCGPTNVLEGGRLRLFRPRTGSAPECVWSLAEDRDGGIWMGTWGNALFRYAGGVVRRYAGADGLTDDVVLALYVDRLGVVWAGTLNGGLYRREGRRFVAYDTAAGLPDNHVTFITEDRAGTLWVGTTGGLAHMRDGRFTAITTADGLSHNSVRAVYEDRDGTLWIGTYGGGLSRLRNGRLTAITAAEGLFDNVVSAILEDDRGNLWMSGNRGIFRVRRSALNDLADGRVRSVHSVAYGRVDGLLWTETNGGFQPAAWKGPDGAFWFPTIRGVAVVQPAQARGHPMPPGVVIERLVVDGRPRRHHNEVRVGPGARSVEVWYTGLSSPAPERITFRYRLAGLDEDWSYVGSRRIAYFTSLAPRRYVFLVSAANRDGVWNETGASLVLVVRPPFWSSWWFRIIVVVALLGTLHAVVRLRWARTQHSQRARLDFERRLLEGQEAERKRIAAELHDSIGQDLLVVKNRAQLALRAPGTAGPAREQLEQISAIVSDTLRGVREIARNLRPAQLDRLGLSAALGATMEKAFEGSGIRFRLEVAGVDGVLGPTAEISVFRMIQEGVTNVLRHSGATEARIALSRGDGVVEVVIADNGRGFHPRGPTEAGFGLSGIGERVRLLGGTFEVRTAEGEGTVLTIRVPVPVSAVGVPVAR